MINIAIYICIISICFADWLFFVAHIGHRYMTWIPELMAMLAFLYVPAAMALRREYRLPPKYTLLLFVYIIHIGTGYFLNSMDSGPIIVGARQFFKFIPIFLLPAVVDFNEKEIKNILILVLLIALVQFPVTIWQRFIQFAAVKSGDPIGGTLGTNTSGVLSVFLIIVISFLVTFFLKKRISFIVFIILFFLCFIPTTINETKITFLLLPFTFILPIYLGKIKLSKNISKIVPLALFALMAISIFISIYNFLGWGKNEADIVKWFSNKQQVEKYTGNTRVIPIVSAFEEISNSDLKTIIFGYGAGNLSPVYNKSIESDLVEKFSIYKPGGLAITKLFLEVGFVGTIIYFLLLSNIFIDGLRLSKLNNDFWGVFSLCMSVFVCFYAVSHTYFNTLNINLFVYLLFFLSGHMVSYKRKSVQIS